MSQVEQVSDVPAEVEDEGWTRGKASMAELAPAVRIGNDEIACCYVNRLSLRENYANVRRIAACLNAFARMTTRGIERLTPEAVEAALVNAEVREARIRELEAFVRLTVDHLGIIENSLVAIESRDREMESLLKLALGECGYKPACTCEHCQCLRDRISKLFDATPAVDAANTQQM